MNKIEIIDSLIKLAAMYVSDNSQNQSPDSPSTNMTRNHTFADYQPIFAEWGSRYPGNKLPDIKVTMESEASDPKLAQGGISGYATRDNNVVVNSSNYPTELPGIVKHEVGHQAARSVADNSYYNTLKQNYNSQDYSNPVNRRATREVEFPSTAQGGEPLPYNNLFEPNPDKPRLTPRDNYYYKDPISGQFTNYDTDSVPDNIANKSLAMKRQRNIVDYANQYVREFPAAPNPLNIATRIMNPDVAKYRANFMRNSAQEAAKQSPAAEKFLWMEHEKPTLDADDSYRLWRDAQHEGEDPEVDSRLFQYFQENPELSDAYDRRRTAGEYPTYDMRAKSEYPTKERGGEYYPSDMNSIVEGGGHIATQEDLDNLLKSNKYPELQADVDAWKAQQALLTDRDNFLKDNPDFYGYVESSPEYKLRNARGGGGPNNKGGWAFNDAQAQWRDQYNAPYIGAREGEVQNNLAPYHTALLEPSWPEMRATAPKVWELLNDRIVTPNMDHTKSLYDIMPADQLKQLRDDILREQGIYDKQETGAYDPLNDTVA